MRHFIRRLILSKTNSLAIFQDLTKLNGAPKEMRCNFSGEEGRVAIIEMGCLSLGAGNAWLRVTKHQLKARCEGQRATCKETYPPGG